jgi:Fic family protein
MEKRMMSDELRKIIRQNEILISLIGRLAFKPDEIRQIVTSRKQNPEKYIEGYNSVDGSHSVSDLAKIIGVTQPTMTTTLSGWEEIGIIYEVEKSGRKFYKKLFPI